MKHKHFNYFDTENWELLDMRTFHTYTDEEFPFTAVKVKIGTCDIEEVKINNQYEKVTYDIIRWMPVSRYKEFVNKGRGAIVW